MTELQNEDVSAFHNFVRMDPAMFQEILRSMGPRIEKFDTWVPQSHQPRLQTCHYTRGNHREISMCAVMPFLTNTQMK